MAWYLVLLLLATFEGGRRYLDPHTAYQLGLSYEQPISCRDLTPAEMDEQRKTNKGKKSNLAQVSASICERPIFSWDERPSLVDHVTAGMAQCVHKVVSALRLYNPDGTFWQKTPIVLDLHKWERHKELLPYTRSSFEVGLTEALGSAAVAKRNHGPHHVLALDYLFVTDPNLACQFTLARSIDADVQPERKGG